MNNMLYINKNVLNCSVGVESNNFYIEPTDTVCKSMRQYVENKKYESLLSRADTLRLNRVLKKEHKQQLPIEPVYTIKSLAKELECNYSTLRKAISGHGKLPITSLRIFSELNNKFKLSETAPAPICPVHGKVCFTIHKKVDRPKRKHWRPPNKGKIERLINKYEIGKKHYFENEQDYSASEIELATMQIDEILTDLYKMLEL